MPRIVDWTGSDLTGLEKVWGLSRIVAEIADDGRVTRELGFDSRDRLVHRFPGNLSRAVRGVFDNAKIEPLAGGDMPPELFELLWST